MFWLVLCFGQVEVLIAVEAAVPKLKFDSSDVFCLTYDLKSVSSPFLHCYIYIYTVLC